MKTSKEIHTIIDSAYPRLPDASKLASLKKMAKESATAEDIYILARLVDETCTYVDACMAYLYRMAIGEIPMPVAKSATAQSPSPAGSPDNGASWVMDGVNGGDTVPPPSAAPGTDNGASWVMSGVDGDAPPPSGVPLVPPPNGGAAVIPNPSSPPVPKEIQAILDKQSQGQTQVAGTAVPPRQSPPSGPRPRK